MGRRKSKKKNMKLITSIVVFVIALFMVLVNGEKIGQYIEKDFSNSVDKTIQKTTGIDATLQGDNILKIYFFDVGQADSELIISSNKTMLIDAGNNEDGEFLVNEIKNLGISKLDYVIGTHPHEDHIGGLDDIINSFEIGEIYMPKVQTNTKTFEDVLDAVSNKNLKITAPDVGFKFELGTSQCEIMQCGIENSKDDLNLSSIVVRVVFGEQSYIFMGDSEKQNEEARNWPKTNVLKVGHHGSDTSSSENFINQIKPEIAVIEVGKDNTYKHPKQVTLDRLAKIGATIFRTDLNGTILIESDGINNKVTVEK